MPPPPPPPPPTTTPASGASDTDFRKTWDKTAYAAKAQAQEQQQKTESKLRYEAKLLGKKYHTPISDPSSLNTTTSRSTRLDVASMVGKSTLIPAGASGVGKKGRGAGFYCEACDMTYKDNVQYIEHLNSKLHLVNTGQSGEVKVATLEDVRWRIEMLKDVKRKREEEEKLDGVVDVKERIEIAEVRDRQEREEKRRKRNEKRRRGGGDGDGDVKREDEWEGRLGIIA